MNIKDFLIDNYLWILGVILLLIITIIGFLADKRRGKKEKAPAPVPNMVDNPNQQPINYQQQFNNQAPQMQMNNGALNNAGPVNNGQPQGPFNMPTPSQTTMNNQMSTQDNTFNQPQPMGNIGNMNQNNQMETIPTPIMAPNIEPMVAPIPNPTMEQITPVGPNFNSQTQMSYQNNPQPVDSIHQENNTPQEPIYQPLSEQTPVIAPREVQNPMNINPQPVQMPSTDPMSIPNVTNMEPIQQPNIPNIINPNVVPTPSPIQDNNFNSVMMPQQPINYQQNFNQPQPSPMMAPQEPTNTIPNPVTPPQPVSPQPINFVYGPSNNNQNMQ